MSNLNLKLGLFVLVTLPPFGCRVEGKLVLSPAQRKAALNRKAAAPVLIQWLQNGRVKMCEAVKVEEKNLLKARIFEKMIKQLEGLMSLKGKSGQEFPEVLRETVTEFRNYYENKNSQLEKKGVQPGKGDRRQAVDKVILLFNAIIDNSLSAEATPTEKNIGKYLRALVETFQQTPTTLDDWYKLVKTYEEKRQTLVTNLKNEKKSKVVASKKTEETLGDFLTTLMKQIEEKKKLYQDLCDAKGEKRSALSKDLKNSEWQSDTWETVAAIRKASSVNNRHDDDVEVFNQQLMKYTGVFQKYGDELENHRKREHQIVEFLELAILLLQNETAPVPRKLLEHLGTLKKSASYEILFGLEALKNEAKKLPKSNPRRRNRRRNVFQILNTLRGAFFETSRRLESGACYCLGELERRNDNHGLFGPRTEHCTGKYEVIKFSQDLHVNGYVRFTNLETVKKQSYESEKECLRDCKKINNLNDTDCEARYSSSESGQPWRAAFEDVVAIRESKNTWFMTLKQVAHAAFRTAPPLAP